jgi:tripartite-type tricarboxylate transporter receptor subunit TctC
MWFGIFLPARAPRDIVDKLHRETLAALVEPKVRAKLTAMGVDPMVMTSAEFDALIEREIAINAALVNAVGLRAQ